MPQHWKQALTGPLSRIMSLWVRPDALPAEPATLLDGVTPVLYMLEHGGIADRVALQLVAERLALPDPSQRLDLGELQEASSVHVASYRQGPIGRRRRVSGARRLGHVLHALRDDTDTDVLLVPVAVYWGRAPGREDSLWRLLFSENWQIAGRTRKFITTLLSGRHTLVRFSDPISLRAFLAAEPAAVRHDTKRLQRKLSRILRVHFRQRRIATLGPDQSHRRMLIDHVIADATVRQAMDDEATGTTRSPERVERRARRYAMEIAADISYPTVRVLHKLLTRLWNELYDGVELDGLHRLEAVADGREIVYVPCHRSHIDYLLLSYILYVNGYSLPHIAAGLNLNLPVVGGLLRRGGAFFLRRTFAGNRLYATVFNAYLTLILQRGHALEYFVEGGRSRTGRLLPPKGGMLAMTVHAYLRNPRMPVVFVPVYFGYERLIEGQSFISELAGRHKRKESLGGLLRSLKFLRENYGKVYVNIGEPIALDTLLDAHHAHWREEPPADARPAWLHPVIDELGDTIMQHINEAASVTPMSLLATALLATPRGVMAEKALHREIDVYHQLLRLTHANSHVVMPAVAPPGVVAHGLRLGFVERREDPIGALIALRPGQAAAVTYFRNNIQHLLVVPSLIACCFAGTAHRGDDEIRRLTAIAYPFLEAELFLADEISDATIQQALDAMQACGLVEHHDGDWRRARAGSGEAVTLQRLAQGVMPALERYYLTAVLLFQAGPAGISRRALAEQCAACARYLSITHGRDVNDLYDKPLFDMLVASLRDRGYIDITDDHLHLKEDMVDVDLDARVLIDEPMRHAILNTTRSFHRDSPPAPRQDASH